MTVPSGEPCGCYDNRGCLDSMYCSCECKCCLVQRQLDANRTCHACKKHKALFWIEYTDLDGDEATHKVCIGCFVVHQIENGLLDPIPEEEEEEERENSTDSDSDCDSGDGYYWRIDKDGRIEYRDEDEHDYDPREEEAREMWDAMDDEERREYWEAYHYFEENGPP